MVSLLDAAGFRTAAPTLVTSQVAVYMIILLCSQVPHAAPATGSAAAAVEEYSLFNAAAGSRMILHNSGQAKSDTHDVGNVSAPETVQSTSPAPTLPCTAPGYLAICVSVKNQNEDLREWLQYHHWLGVSHFYIHDHDSVTPASQFLEDYIRDGVVTYQRFSWQRILSVHREFAKTAQGHVFSECLQQAKGRNEWVAFIDIDEFLVLEPPFHNNASCFLQQYEQYAGLGVNWRMFGSSGHKTRPAGLTLASYTRCFVSRQIKSIVHMRYVSNISSNPHRFTYVDGMQAVNEAGEAIASTSTPPSRSSRIKLHHYVLKSYQEFLEKVERGGGTGPSKLMSFYHAMDKKAANTCLQGTAAARRWCGESGNATHELKGAAQEALASHPGVHSVLMDAQLREKCAGI